MPTRVCPSCGAQYLATVQRCSDCDEELVDAPDDSVVEAAGLGEERPADQVAYELGEWSSDARVALDGMLARQDIVHVWEAGTLVVRADDEGRVDELVDEVEVSEQPTLDPDADQVVYEIRGWDEAQRADLEAVLIADDIAHGWDENRDLVVLEADTDRVEPILDRVDMEDELTVEEVVDSDDDDSGDEEADDDGLAAQDAMSELFLITDRLMKNPGDDHEVDRLRAATERLDQLALPYGFSIAVWNDLKTQAGGLRDLLVETADDEAVTEAATILRHALRQYV